MTSDQRNDESGLPACCSLRLDDRDTGRLDLAQFGGGGFKLWIGVRHWRSKRDCDGGECFANSAQLAEFDRERVLPDCIKRGVKMRDRSHKRPDALEG